MTTRDSWTTLALILVGLAATVPEAVFAQSTRYVTDEFEITLRRGPSTQNAITRMLGSGTQLEVLDSDPETGYSRVRTRGGTEGYVLTRYLMAEPSARSQLAAMTERLETLRGERGSQGRILDDLRQQNTANEAQIRQLESENRRLEAELSEIRRTAANAININEQNKVLREDLSQANIKVSTLEQENDRLVRRRDQNWFLIGAAVLVVGVLLGLVLPRIPRTRRNRWSDSL